ncbi:hypothetical protein [Acinetobacter baumannii]|uniref:hypothetical protein n=1 Tax=Acinetobacter baumannii TaxID=470 RepID=UPI00148A556F|nr:hypothetical protein [Acinetobacter baumannii]
MTTFSLPITESGIDTVSSTESSGNLLGITLCIDDTIVFAIKPLYKATPYALGLLLILYEVIVSTLLSPTSLLTTGGWILFRNSFRDIPTTLIFSIAGTFVVLGKVIR